MIARLRLWRRFSPWLGVLALCLLGTVLRWPDPQRQLEYDEVIAVLFARHGFVDIVRATAADTMPPLYYWLLHLWHPAGDDLRVARLLSTALSVGTVPVVYLLGRRLSGTADGLVAAALFAVSPFTVFYGHYARMYALLTLLGMLAAYFFVRWLRDGHLRDLAGFTLATVLSLYTHNLAVLLLASLDALFVVRGLWPTSGEQTGREPEWGRPRLLPLVLAHLALLAAYLPWLAYLPGQLEKVTRAFWIPTPGAAELVRTTLVFLFHLPLPGPLLGPAAFVALVCLAVAVAETRRRWLGAPDRRPGIQAAVALAMGPVALMFLVSQVRPVYVERAVMSSAAVYYLLLAGALRGLPLRPLAWAVIFAGVVVIAAAHGYQNAYEGFPRSPHHALVDQLRGVAAQGDLVLHDNKLSYFPAYFFAPDLDQAYLWDEPGSPNDTLAQGTIDVLGLPPSRLEDAVAGRERVWFVVYRQALEEAERAGRPHANKAWLDQRYRGQPHLQVGDLQVWVYYVGSL